MDVPRAGAPGRRPGADAEVEVTVHRDRCADPLRHRLRPPERRADAVRRVHLRVAVDGRVAEADTTLVDDEALAAALGARCRRPSSRSTAGRAWRPGRGARRRPLGRRDRGGRAGRARGPSRGVRRRAGGLETAGFCSTEGSRWPSPTRPASASPARHRRRARRHRKDRSSDGVGPAVGPAGGHRRPAVGGGPRKCPRGGRRDRPRAGPLRGRPRRRASRTSSAFLPSTASTGGRWRRAIVREAGRAPVRPGDLAGRRRHGPGQLGIPFDIEGTPKRPSTWSVTASRAGSSHATDRTAGGRRREHRQRRRGRRPVRGAGGHLSLALATGRPRRLSSPASGAAST